MCIFRGATVLLDDYILHFLSTYFHIRKSGKKKRKAGEDEEGEGYENQERTFDQMHQGKKVKGLLPIKTDKGIIQRFKEVEGEYSYQITFT